jgi:hypothetical protein
MATRRGLKKKAAEVERAPIILRKLVLGRPKEEQ